uniref:Uncharacterized protein n=1 Tax=Anguilla anguilla TaxID=7936 RepID=A0A0E9V177_ANGAN
MAYYSSCAYGCCSILMIDYELSTINLSYWFCESTVVTSCYGYF